MTVADDSLEAVVAERLIRAARAAQDLCDVLWEALHEELSDRSLNGPHAQRVADLSERVADVSATVMALVRYAKSNEVLREPSQVKPSAAPEPAAAPAPSAAPRTTVIPEPVTVPGGATMPGPATQRSEAVIVDERVEEDSERIGAVDQPVGAEQPVSDSRTWPAIAHDQPSSAGEQQPRRGRPLPWDDPPREEMRVTRRAADRP
jgi:hypothetical protein